MFTLLKNFINDQEGVSIIEYGLIATVVAVGCVSGLQKIQSGVKGQISHTRTAQADSISAQKPVKNVTG